MIESKGQVSGEYILLIGVLIIVVMMAIVCISHENELNIAVMAARNGVMEASQASSSAIYPDDAFEEYSDSKSGLLHPYSLTIVNVSYNELGFDSNYDKERIQFRVYAKTSGNYDNGELTSIGDRINYNLRKSIAISFNTTSTTNRLYNPVFSKHYVFTTANVKWI